MQPNKQTVDFAILKLSAIDGKLPEVSQIEDFTNLQAITIIRNLDAEYPKELLITKRERTILNAYQENHSLISISEKTGISYYDVSNTITRLKKKGIIKVQKKEKIKVDPPKPTYVEIVKDVFFKISKDNVVNVKGMQGYVEGTGLKRAIAYIYINRIRYEIPVNHSDYLAIGGKFYDN